MHIIGLSTLSLMYVGWAYVGKIFTGNYVYFFFDFQQIGWENVLIAVVSFCGLSIICKSLIAAIVVCIANTGSLCGHLRLYWAAGNIDEKV